MKKTTIFHYFMVYIVMGSTYFFIKQAILTVPPAFVLSFRFLTGGTLLIILARIKDGILKRPNLKEIGSSFVIGVLLFVTGVGLVTLGQQYTYSYITSLIVASVPLLVALFDSIFFKKRTSFSSWLGILFGLGGIAFLFFNQQEMKLEITYGLVFILVGIISWSLATSISHRFPTYGNTLVHSGIQMLFAGSICFLVFALSGESIGMVLKSASCSSLISLLYLGVIGSFSFNSYNYLITHEPPQKVSTYAFVNPVVGIIFGIAFGREKTVPNLLGGVLLILLGLFFHFYGKRFSKFK